MKILKIPIYFLEAMKFPNLDVKRATIDDMLAERVNALVDEIESLQERVQDLEDIRGR